MLHLCEDADFTLQGLLSAVAAANFARTVSIEYFLKNIVFHLIVSNSILFFKKKTFFVW